MNEYNGFDGNTRTRNSRLIDKAVEAGLKEDKHETTCWICGQDKGIREYHAEDYSAENIVEESKILCKKCHRHIHSPYRTENWLKYEEDVNNGFIAEPMYDSKWTEEDDRPIKNRGEPVGFKHFWKYHEEMVKKLGC